MCSSCMYSRFVERHHPQDRAASTCQTHNSLYCPQPGQSVLAPAEQDRVANVYIHTGNTNTNTKYTCDTGQTRNKLLAQWVHLTNHAAGHSRPGTGTCQTGVPSRVKEGRNDSLETSTRVQTPLPAAAVCTVLPVRGAFVAFLCVCMSVPALSWGQYRHYTRSHELERATKPKVPNASLAGTLSPVDDVTHRELAPSKPPGGHDSANQSN
jgi:hypothetical protein